MPLSKEVRELATQISGGRIFQTETTVKCKGPTVYSRNHKEEASVAGTE